VPKLRTAKVFVALVSTYVLLSLPAWFGPTFLEGISSVIYMTPILAVYLLHTLGVPGLLEHNGHCGWGLCSPTIFGWTFLAVFWVCVLWFLAWGIARVTLRPDRRAQTHTSKGKRA
jgi:hypothetical protein